MAHCAAVASKAVVTLYYVQIKHGIETGCIPQSSETENMSKTRKLLSLIYKRGADSWQSEDDSPRVMLRSSSKVGIEPRIPSRSIPYSKLWPHSFYFMWKSTKMDLWALSDKKSLPVWRLFPACRAEALFSRVSNKAVKTRKGGKCAPGSHLIILTAVNVMYPLMLSHFSV